MTETAGHTPTPWAVSGRYLQGPPYEDEDGDLVALIIATIQVADRGDHEQVSNAAFIVKAVNSHEALVDALKHIAICWDGSRGKAEHAADVMRQIARNALIIAEAETTEEAA